jgi:6-phosphogluconolactonase
LILTRFDDGAAAGRAVAEQVAGALREGLAARGSGSLAVPGGRTPVAMFQALRDAPLEWPRVGVTLTDERWVPESDPASNGALVRRELLQGRAATARFQPLFDGSATAGEAVIRVWGALAQLVRPFDAVVLGMGEDGHFASLFAGNEGLAQALDVETAPACVAMTAAAWPRQRISLNLAALLQTRRLIG